jgi:hypothetical protein
MSSKHVVRDTYDVLGNVDLVRDATKLLSANRSTPADTLHTFEWIFIETLPKYWSIPRSLRTLFACKHCVTTGCDQLWSIGQRRGAYLEQTLCGHLLDDTVHHLFLSLRVSARMPGGERGRTGRITMMS